jgi:HK97 family phage prohead protease
MLVRKHLSLSDAALKMDGDTGRFAGYASTFGGVDSYGDTIVKGAYIETLRSGAAPLMFLEHAWAGLSAGAAAMPIGKWTKAQEDDHGLYVEGELTPGMSLSTDVRAALKHGTLSGLSVGGYVRKGDYDETEKGRTIRKWSKLVEISVVAMPANTDARVDASTVKGADILDAIAEIETIRDLESLLRDAAGLSKSAATALAGRAKLIFAPQGEPAGDAEQRAMKAVAERLRRMAA